MSITYGASWAGRVGSRNAILFEHHTAEKHTTGMKYSHKCSRFVSTCRWCGSIVCMDSAACSAALKVGYASLMKDSKAVPAECFKLLASTGGGVQKVVQKVVGAMKSSAKTAVNVESKVFVQAPVQFHVVVVVIDVGPLGGGESTGSSCQVVFVCKENQLFGTIA